MGLAGSMRCPDTIVSMSPPVDLRSDTVTVPTARMRRAMADAPVGDDGYGEDPTVRALEEAFATKVAKPASLFVPSGVMGNQIALRLHGRPGTAVVAGEHSHVVAYELGAAAINSPIQFHLVDDSSGGFDASVVDRACQGARYHQPEVSAVFVENTHMSTGGRPWGIERLRAVRRASGDRPIHMDGARLFNAQVATGIDASTFAAEATTVMTCLSKGLCAPVGSMLAGPSDLIDVARTERKRLGGAMRQAGILAAAGLVALDEMIERLAEDHERARRLAIAVSERWPDVVAEPSDLQTNVVVFYPPDPDSVIAHLFDHGVLAQSVGPGNVRLVTHADVDDEGIEIALGAIRSAP